MGTDSKVVTGDYYDGTANHLAMGFRYNGNDIAVSGDNAIGGDAKHKYAI